MNLNVASLLRPDDPPERQAEKLRRIAAAVIRRSEAAPAPAAPRAPSRSLGRGAGALPHDGADAAALFALAANRSRAAAAPEAGPGARAVLDALPLAVCVFDADRRLALWNRRAEAVIAEGMPLEAGRSFEEVLGRGLGSRRHVDREAPRRVAAWVAAGAPRRPMTVELRERQGRTFDLAAEDVAGGGFLISLCDRGADRDALRALHDVNHALEAQVMERSEALNAAREAEARANAAKTRFLAAAGHDLLQPLNAARLFLEALGDSGLDPEQARLADRLGRAFDSIDAQLGALLDLSRLDAGMAELRPSAFPIARLFDPLREEFGALAARKGIALRVAPSGVEVRSDPALLRRALQNLVSNAVRYTAEGSVLVGVRRCGPGAVAIEIRDSGPGIAPELHETVFEEFRRLPSGSGEPHAADDPGMGIGLPIVARTCALLGHALEMRSAPGRGACFRVVVPLAEPPAAEGEDAAWGATRAAVAAAEAGAGETGAAVDLDDMIVLVIQPEGAPREALLARLEAWGACPLAACDLAEAIEAVADLGAPADMVLAAPTFAGGEDGLETIRTLRAFFGTCPAALLAANPSADLPLGRAAEAEDVETLPLDDAGGRLRAALAVAREF